MDSITELNVTLDEGFVSLFIDRDKKVAFTSNINGLYIDFENAKLLYTKIKENEANRKIEEWKATGEIVTNFSCAHKFYI